MKNLKTLNIGFIDYFIKLESGAFYKSQEVSLKFLLLIYLRKIKYEKSLKRYNSDDELSKKELANEYIDYFFIGLKELKPNIFWHGTIKNSAIKWSKRIVFLIRYKRSILLDFLMDAEKLEIDKLYEICNNQIINWLLQIDNEINDIDKMIWLKEISNNTQNRKVEEPKIINTVNNHFKVEDNTKIFNFTIDNSIKQYNIILGNNFNSAHFYSSHENSHAKNGETKSNVYTEKIGFEIENYENLNSNYDSKQNQDQITEEKNIEKFESVSKIQQNKEFYQFFKGVDDSNKKSKFQAFITKLIEAHLISKVDNFENKYIFQNSGTIEIACLIYIIKKDLCKFKANELAVAITNCFIIGDCKPDSLRRNLSNAGLININDLYKEQIEKYEKIFKN